MKTEKIKKLIYKELDGSLSGKEAAELKSALESSAGLRQYQHEAAEMRTAVKNSAVTSFKPFFEESLMNRIAELPAGPASLAGLTDAIIFSSRKFVLTAAVILGLLVSYNITSGNNHSITSIFGGSEASIESAFSPLQNFAWSTK